MKIFLNTYFGVVKAINLFLTCYITEVTKYQPILHPLIFTVGNKPMIILGGEKRISRRMALVSENWIFPGVDNPLVSYGVRFFGEGLSVDMAFFNTIGENFLFPGIPYIDFVFCF